jgi:hypothetical protein
MVVMATARGVCGVNTVYSYLLASSGEYTINKAGIINSRTAAAILLAVRSYFRNVVGVG